MKPEIAALYNARHYMRLALSCIDRALEGERDPLLGQTPRDDAHELVRQARLRGVSCRDVSAIFEACARGDFEGARQLAGEAELGARQLVDERDRTTVGGEG